jgi:hypothetical protein
MFHFLRFPYMADAMHNEGSLHWVSPFGYHGLLRLHTPRPRFSQCTTSFFGTGRQGIPRMLFFALTLITMNAFHNQFCTSQ